MCWVWLEPSATKFLMLNFVAHGLNVDIKVFFQGSWTFHGIVMTHKGTACLACLNRVHPLSSSSHDLEQFSMTL